VTFVPFGGLEQQPETRVFDEDGALLGHLKADLLVENRLILTL
jgi:hypothetical protein